VTSPRPVPLGRYWRSRPFTCPLEGRYRVECGSQKETSTWRNPQKFWICPARRSGGNP